MESLDGDAGELFQSGPNQCRMRQRHMAETRRDAMMQVNKGGGADGITPEETRDPPTTSLKFSQLPLMLFDSLTGSHGATFSAAQNLKHIYKRTSEIIKVHRPRVSAMTAGDQPTWLK